MSLKNRINKTKYRHNKSLKNVYISGQGKDFRIRFVSKELFDPNAHLFFDYYLHSLVNRFKYTKSYMCLTKKNNCPACEDAYKTMEAEKVANVPKKTGWRKIKRKTAVYLGFVDFNGVWTLSLIHIPDYVYNNKDNTLPTLNDNLQKKMIGFEENEGIDVFDPVDGRDIIIRIKGEDNNIVTKIEMDIDSKRALTQSQLDEVKQATNLDEVYKPLTRIQMLGVIQQVPTSEAKDFSQIKKEKARDSVDSEKIEMPDITAQAPEEEIPEEIEAVKETKVEDPKKDLGESIEMNVDEISVDSFYEDDSLDDKFNNIMDDK